MIVNNSMEGRARAELRRAYLLTYLNADAPRRSGSGPELKMQALRFILGGRMYTWQLGVVTKRAGLRG